MERLRSINITVEVDTNKMTYEKEFDDVDEMLYWLDMLELGIRPTNIAADFVCPLVCPQCKNTAHYFDGDGVHCWFCEPLNYPPQVIRDWVGEDEDKAWAHLDNPPAHE